MRIRIEWFPSSDGTRCRAGGGGGGGQPGGGGGQIGGFGGGSSALTWFGNDVASYEAAYDGRSNDSPDAWAALIGVCDVLNNTPLDQLAVSLDRVLDAERALMYLAVENVFVDEDGYLFKGADYFLYWEVETGRFHPIQHDANEVMGASTMRLGSESWGPTVFARLKILAVCFIRVVGRPFEPAVTRPPKLAPGSSPRDGEPVSKRLKD